VSSDANLNPAFIANGPNIANPADIVILKMDGGFKTRALFNGDNYKVVRYNVLKRRGPEEVLKVVDGKLDHLEGRV